MNHPLQSLASGQWFKLICGASFQHLPAIRYLAIAYSLAGADCIDIAADPAVIRAVQQALNEAERYAQGSPGISASGRSGAASASHPQRAQPLRLDSAVQFQRPWLMVSLNDGEDPHFRKAEFDPQHCPADCPRPCQPICPAEAITFAPTASQQGVIAARCYGCGRCLSVCPIQQITTRSHQLTPAAIADILNLGIDGIEIHTQVGHFAGFQRLWQVISPKIHQLKVLAISCPNGTGVIDYLRSLQALISPLPIPLIWQADGRPMSGDIGQGTTHATIQYGQQLLQANLPGYVQLAGGTNDTTVAKLRSRHLLPPDAAGRHIAGVAYGSYARTALAAVISQLDHLDQHQGNPAQWLDLMAQAVDQARSLVEPLKYSITPRSVAAPPPVLLGSARRRGDCLSVPIQDG